MRSTICTLFENEYHYGVGALANSLYASGFRGEIYAGYKGTLPNWANSAVSNPSLGIPNATTLSISKDFSLHFIPLATSYHLTNYKPDFMLSLLNGPAKKTDVLFYYDPDIIQKVSWDFMEDWVDTGIAVCEDINSPIHENHPKRIYWRKYFANYGHQLKYKSSIYVNGGFIGLKKSDFAFLSLWKSIQENMADEIGSLSYSIFENREKLFEKAKGDFYAFGTSDQDALNAAIEVFNHPFSFFGKDAMGFESGFMIIPHALGKPKPWNNTYLKSWILRGIKPSMISLLYWRNCEFPIKLYSNYKISIEVFSYKFVSFLSRFYKA